MAARARCLCQIVVFSYICIYYGVIAHVGSMMISSVPIKAVPFVASLMGARRCSASVVHEKFLLTAASCLVDDSGARIILTKAIVGTNNPAKGGQSYLIDNVLPHTKYSIHTGDYNVGLVRLADKIAFGPNVGPIKLGKRVAVGDLVNVVGWGTGKESSTGLLHEVSVPVLPDAECQQGLLGRIISPRMLCAGVTGEGLGDCVGDEGGPVFANKTLVAVVSRLTGCGRLPALYTRVSAVRRWITKTILENNDIDF